MVAMLRIALVLSLPAASSALAAGRKPQAASRVVHLATPADGPKLVVDVPVVEVIMVESPMDAARPMKRERHGPSASCQKEMEELAMNRTRVMNSRACEDRKGYAKHAIASLQRANMTDAMGSIEKTFHECAALTASCAKEMAPEVEQKMRLSGVTVESHCAEAAKEAQRKMTGKGGACQENATRSMVDELAKESLDGAMAAAMGGLHNCSGLAAPCDFQLAPILVMQLLQAREQEEEQAMMRALIGGLRQAAERSKKLVSNEKPGPVNGEKTSKKVFTAEKKHKTVSLIDIAERVHIGSERQTVYF